MDTRQALLQIAGLALAPLVAGASYLPFTALLSDGLGSNSDAAGAFLATALLSAAFMAVAGGPSLILAYRFNLARWWVAAIVGLTGGTLVGWSLHVRGLDLLRFSLTGVTPALFVWWCCGAAFARKLGQAGT